MSGYYILTNWERVQIIGEKRHGDVRFINRVRMGLGLRKGIVRTYIFPTCSVRDHPMLMIASFIHS